MRVLVLVLALLAAGVATFTLVRTESERPRDDSRSDPRSPIERVGGRDVDAIERLSRTVDDLRVAVEQLNRRLAERIQAPESQAVRGADAVAVDRIMAKPEAAESSLPGVPRARDPPDPELRRRFEQLREEDEQQLNRSHWFWSFAETIERYGPPDEIQAQQPGQVNFVYKAKNFTYTFIFNDRMLLRVDRYQHE